MSAFEENAEASMATGIQFTGRFAAEPLSALVPGAWYIGFACKRCREHFAILNEPTNTGRLQLSGDAVISASCPSCGVSEDYPAGELTQFQAAQGGPISTA
jgi:hypothetical protein